MAIYEVAADELRKIEETSFSQAGVHERADLQRLLRKQVDIIAPATLIVAEEFGEWEDSRRRIDLLGIDKDANLVVIELKRNEDGGHMELQAIRYAAMVSTMTFDKTVEVFAKFLGNSEAEARSTLLEFLEWEEPDEDHFAQDVRIVLVAAEFSKELTTAVMWLNERDLEIRCVRIKPYSYNGRVLIDVQQVIPLREAEEYLVHIREKEQKGRQERAERRLTKNQQLYLEYWQAFINRPESKGSHFWTKPTTRSYAQVKLGTSKWLAAYLSPDREDNIWVGFKCADGDFWERLKSLRDQIDEKVKKDGTPVWQDEEQGHGWVGFYKQADPDDRDDWPQQQTWLYEMLYKLHEVFGPLTENLGRGEDGQQTIVTENVPSP